MGSIVRVGGPQLENTHFEIAPIFDNGAAFSNKLPENKITEMLSHPERIKSSVSNAVTIYAINGQQLKAFQLLNLDEIGLNKALIKNIPLIQERMAQIKDFINSIPETTNMIDRTLVFSNERKAVYIKQIEERFEQLLWPAYNKAQDMLMQKPLSLIEQLKEAKESFEKYKTKSNKNEITNNKNYTDDGEYGDY